MVGEELEYLLGLNSVFSQGYGIHPTMQERVGMLENVE